MFIVFFLGLLSRIVNLCEFGYLSECNQCRCHLLVLKHSPISHMDHLFAFDHSRVKPVGINKFHQYYIFL